MADPNRYTLTPDEIAAGRKQARWNAIKSFTNAPCLQPSLATGAAGGAGIFALRYLTSAGMVTAVTWGASVFGLLAGANWIVCRRAMYAQLAEEARLVNLRDPRALREHAEKIRARQARER
eukprot:scaffold5037_cov114-Isochrysis_galbana.AAC.15